MDSEDSKEGKLSVKDMLKTPLTSAGQEDDTIIYISIRQVALLVCFRFKSCNFASLPKIIEKK